MSLAYLVGTASGKATGTKLNIPLLMVIAILPDIDLAFEELTGILIHRGPTHSLIIAVLVFLPIFVIYRKKALPYFLALLSHSLLGDFLVGGEVQLFWPYPGMYGLFESGLTNIGIHMAIGALLEVTLFASAMFVMYRTGDLQTFFRNDKTNLLLILPIVTVMLPAIVGYPFTEAPLLLKQPTLGIAHVIYLILFTIAVAKTLTRYYKTAFNGLNPEVLNRKK